MPRGPRKIGGRRVRAGPEGAASRFQTWTTLSIPPVRSCDPLGVAKAIDRTRAWWPGPARISIGSGKNSEAARSAPAPGAVAIARPTSPQGQATGPLVILVCLAPPPPFGFGHPPGKAYVPATGRGAHVVGPPRTRADA